MGYILLISPYESKSAKWEAELFPDLEKAEKSIHDRDLTKEYYLISADELVRLLRVAFDGYPTGDE